MDEPTSRNFYVIDSSVIITLNASQPRDVYPSVWGKLENLIAEGRANLPQKAYEELIKKTMNVRHGQEATRP